MKVNKREVVKAMAKRVLEEGGEGLMLRLSRSLYVPGRSTNLLKFKVLITIIIV